MKSKRTYCIGKFIHVPEITLTEPDTFNGILCVDDDSGKIRVIFREFTASGCVDPPPGYEISPETLEDLKGIGLDASDVVTRILDALKGDHESTTIYIAKSEQFFFPGLIDTHIHACQYPNSGLFGHGSLLEWLKEYTYPMEERLSDPSIAERVYKRCISRTLSNGTTCASYYATIHQKSTDILAKVCLDKGQRAFIGRCNMDIGIEEEEEEDPDDPPYHDKDATTALEDTEKCITYIKGIDPTFKLIRPILTPRFAYNCSEGLLKDLGDRAKKGLEMPDGTTVTLPCQTHIAENKKEYEEVLEKFKKIDKNIDGYAHVYEKYGLLRNDTILAHAVHLTQNDINRIVRANSKVAHCPISNVALLSGNAKVRNMIDSGIAVGLGTDHAGGYSPSILKVIRDTTMVSRIVAVEEEVIIPKEDKLARLLARPEHYSKLSVTEALYLGTVGGAKVMGLEGKVGYFKEEMEWDACLIGLEIVPTGKDEDLPLDSSISPVDIFEIREKPSDRIEKWVYSGDDRNFLKVWVQGRLVHQKRAPE